MALEMDGIIDKRVHNRQFRKELNVLLSPVILFLIFVFYNLFEKRSTFYAQIFKTPIFEYMYNKCIKNRLNRINDYIP